MECRARVLYVYPFVFMCVCELRSFEISKSHHFYRDDLRALYWTAIPCGLIPHFQCHVSCCTAHWLKSYVYIVMLSIEAATKRAFNPHFILGVGFRKVSKHNGGVKTCISDRIRRSADSSNLRSRGRKNNSITTTIHTPPFRRLCVVCMSFPIERLWCRQLQGCIDQNTSLSKGANWVNWMLCGIAADCFYVFWKESAISV